MTNSDCPFCKISIESNDNHTYGLIPTEVLKSLVFFETSNFFLLLDIAPIVPHHCLLVSKRHIPGFAYCSLSEITEATSILERFSKSLGKVKRRSITIFEHSTPDDNGETCCVNHAHIHILPLDVNFSSQFEKDGYSPLMIASYNQAQNLRGKAYLFYQYGDQEGGFYDASFMPSQYIRILYGRIKNQRWWNWHDRVFVAKDSKVIKQLSSSFNFLDRLKF